MDLETATSVIKATGVAVDIFDKVVSQITAFMRRQPEKEVNAGEERWRHKIKEKNNELVVSQNGKQLQVIKAEDLKELPPDCLQLIQTFEETMQRNFRLWTAVYKKRDASPDALVNAQTDEQLTELVRKMQRDLTGIVDFLQRLGLHLDDHYMSVRHLVDPI